MYPGEDDQVGRKCWGRREVRLVAAALGAVALVTCGRGDRPGPVGPTVPVEETTTTVAAIDITHKPEVVTVDYAQAVMVELDRVLGEAVRAMVADGGPNKEFLDKLNAVYDEPSFEDKQSVYGEIAADGMEAFRNPPGDPVTKLERVLRSDPHCVVLAVDRTFAAFLASPNPREDPISYIALAPKVGDSDPAGFNRTPWSIVFDGGTLDGTEPLNAC